MLLNFKKFCMDINEKCPKVAVKDFSEEEISKAFGDSLKKLRKHKELSLNALSEYVDIPNPTINRYENGINIPTITQAIKLSNFFRVSIEAMVFFGLAELHKDIVFKKNIIDYYESSDIL